MFRRLATHKAALEASYQSPLEWEELPGKRSCRIAAYGEGDVAQLDEHEAYIDWFFDSSTRLREAIASLIPALQSTS